MKKISFVVIALIFISILQADVLVAEPFIEVAKLADFIGLVKIDGILQHGYYFEIIDEYFNRFDEQNLNFFWGPSNLNPDRLKPPQGHSNYLIVALFKIDKENVYENRLYRFTEKKGTYCTTEIGECALMVIDNVVTGQIQEPFGQINNKYGVKEFVPYQEEYMAYNKFKEMVLKIIESTHEELK